jgi:hypothetical protein
MVMAGMEAPLERKKKARSNACLTASDIFGGSGRETRSEILPNSGGFAQACAAARAASRKTVFWPIFTRIDILSGPNHTLNVQITLVRATKKGRAVIYVRSKSAADSVIPENCGENKSGPSKPKGLQLPSLQATVGRHETYVAVDLRMVSHNAIRL